VQGSGRAGRTTANYGEERCKKKKMSSCCQPARLTVQLVLQGDTTSARPARVRAHASPYRHHLVFTGGSVLGEMMRVRGQEHSPCRYLTPCMLRGAGAWEGRSLPAMLLQILR
jgi:hypothetical protein